MVASTVPAIRVRIKRFMFVLRRVRFIRAEIPNDSIEHDPRRKERCQL
jgi:hypothetical protein